MSTRKIRIVCISDTHDQTPKLPAGDILIHAGDLTNQGSYSELKKTVEWLEKADFRTKIIVAGNHDTTLDPLFFHNSSNKWKWPSPQDPIACRKLITDSPSITYLEHKSTIITLPSLPNTPQENQTRLKIFGSPYSPGRRGWAFQYEDDQAAVKLWGAIEDDVDIVITHTPAQGHCDMTTNIDMVGCAVLNKVVGRVCPVLHVCGHIHDARGVERVGWADDAVGDRAEGKAGSMASVEHWTDPGLGNKKLSLVDLTAKGGRKLDRGKETCVVNAAILGARQHGKAMVLNKPIVIDIDVPISPATTS
ncbi:hypothetical protein NX059_010023 [Plenodomus lindquistii]|nr:hypothetical protein NX059_010023 [Plenodomus lindquistii]